MRQGSLSKGLWLIVLGSLLMLNTMGIVNWGVWVYLLQWWPVVLIALGLQMLLRRRVFHLVLAILLVAGTVMYVSGGQAGFSGFSGFSWSGGGEQQQYRFNQEMPGGTASGDLSLGFGAGRLSIEGGAAGLLEGELGYNAQQPTVDIDQEDGRTEVRVAQRPENFFFPGKTMGTDWRVLLSEKIPWDIKLDVGATSAVIDLSRLVVRTLDVNAGASELRVTLGSLAPKVEVDIDTGAASVVLQVPAKAGLRVNMGSALSSNNLESEGFTRRGKEYTTENWSTAPVTIDISFSAGASNLQVIRSGEPPLNTGKRQPI